MDKKIGKVLWFNVSKGFGFIRSEEKDYFVHYSKILAAPGEFRLLLEAQTVEFEPFMVERENGGHKAQAKNVTVIEGGENAILRKESDTNLGGLTNDSEKSSV